MLVVWTRACRISLNFLILAAALSVAKEGWAQNVPTYSQSGNLEAAAGGSYFPPYRSGFQNEDVTTNPNINYARGIFPTTHIGSSSGTAAPALFNYQTRLDDGTPDGQLVNFSAEAYAHAEYKRRIVQANGHDTVITTMFGPEYPDRPYRVLRNRVVNQWAGREDQIPDPPPPAHHALRCHPPGTPDRRVRQS